MKHLLTAALLLLAACKTAPDDAVPAPGTTTGAGAEPVRSYTIRELMEIDSIGDASFSPDNSEVLFTSLRTGTQNLYVMPVDGGTATALTHSDKETVSSIGYFPDDERIVVSMDDGGDERSHIYVRETDGSFVDLTPGEGHVARWVDWADDGGSFYLVTNERDPRYFDLYEYAVNDYSRQRIFENERAYQVEDVSPDGRLIALSRIHDNRRIDVLLHDLETGEQTTLTQEGGHVFGGRFATFAPNGRDILFPGMEGREFLALYRYDVVTGKRDTVFAPEWDVNGASFSDDGRYLVVVVNENARSRPYLFDAAYEPVDLGMAALAPGKNVSIAFANDGAPLALVGIAGNATPQEVHVLDLDTGKMRLLLDALPANVDASHLVDGKVIRFPSYDGVPVPGILSIPHGARRDGSRPAVIEVHGGPGGESRVGYQPLVQYLVNHGYVVFEINNRGSSGSGKTFHHLDDHAHGDADLDDLVAAKRMLVGTGYVDPDRVAVLGGSYGGYLTLAALTFRPVTFAAGVDLYGVSNWPRLLRSTPAWWEDLSRLLRTEMGDVETEEAYLESISPYFHADRIVRPLLVLQGANDPRVLQEESDDIVEKVRENGVPVEYIVFPDEGHGFRKKANQEEAYEAILTFLDEHVRDTDRSAASAQTPPDESKRLEAFFERVYERDLARSPMRQSALGIRTDQDKWDDISEARRIENAELERADLERLREFDYDALTPSARLSYDLFEYNTGISLKLFEWRRNVYEISHRSGVQNRIPHVLINNHPIASRDDAEDYIARLTRVRPLFTQLVIELERDEQAGTLTPRFDMLKVIGTLENLVSGAPFDTSGEPNSIWSDFTRKIAEAELPDSDKDALLRDAEAAMRGGFRAGVEHLIAWLEGAAERTPGHTGVWKLADGDAFYEAMLEWRTTTSIRADEVHELGLSEVERIHAQMRTIMDEVGFDGGLDDFFEFVRSDRRFYYENTDEGRAAYLARMQSVLDELEPRLPELFSRLPKADMEIKRVEPWLEKSAGTAGYFGPSADGSRPGYLYVNLYDMDRMPRYEISSLAYHEGIPGHHLQVALAQEMEGLPKFRLYGGYTAFSEGWALYAEQLPREIGLQTDPYQRFGRLSMELLRAGRLVVDSGLHAKRWTREEAIAWLDKNTPVGHAGNIVAVDRYATIPAQATAYEIGKLKMMALREKAKDRLGARFDLAAFNDAVLSEGPLPLPILEAELDSWLNSRLDGRLDGGTGSQ